VVIVGRAVTAAIAAGTGAAIAVRAVKAADATATVVLAETVATVVRGVSAKAVGMKALRLSLRRRS
jgi:hypothetical protein